MGAACTGQTGLSLVTLRDDVSPSIRRGKVPKKVLLIGPKGSGKTTLLYTWCLKTDTDNMADEVLNIKPTESFNVEVISGAELGQTLLVWDVTDTARRRQFYHGTEAIVYVVDGSDTFSIDMASVDLTSVLQDRDLMNLPLLFVVSKQDIQDSASIAEIEDKLRIKDIRGNRKFAHASITKNDKLSFHEARQKLCDIMYSCNTKL